MRPARRYLLAALVAALLLGVGGAAYWRFGRAVEIPVSVAAQGAVAARVVGPGTVQARVPVTVSARVGSTVVEVLADVGDTVQAGQLLARLDDPGTRAAVELERAAMRAVEAGCAAPFGALARANLGDLSIHAVLATGAGARRSIVVGPIASADELALRVAADVAPLRGLRVLIPPSGLADVLEAERTTVNTQAFTVTEPLAVTPFVQALTEAPDVIAFTSARTVRVLTEGGVDLATEIPLGTTIAAVGDATAAALREAGLRVGLKPTNGSGGAALAGVFADGPGTVLIPGAAAPKLITADMVRQMKAGAVLVDVAIDQGG